METRRRRRVTKVVGGLIGGLVLIAGLAVLTHPLAAQPGPPPGQQMGPGRGMGPGGMMGGLLGQGPMGQLFGPGLGAVDLSDAQRAQIRDIRQKHAGELRPLLERVAAARQALADAMHAAPVDDNALQVAGTELGAAAGALAVAQAQNRAEILSVLTPEQREKLEARRNQMEQRRLQQLNRMRNRRNPPPPPPL